MSNLALGRPIAEAIRNPQAATDGDIAGYTGKEGFAELIWPGYLTVDLGKISKISTIRLLLWDGLGAGGGPRDSRGYKYRLLISPDRYRWSVIFDTGAESYTGWQVFTLKEPLPTQYVRVHCLWNSANIGFHIVQLEAHDGIPPELPAGATVECEVGPGNIIIEEADGLPMEQSIDALVVQLENILSSYEILNPDPFRAVIAQLRLQVADVSALERRMGAVRRQLVEPVATELKHGRKYSVGGFWFGLAGWIVGVLSFITTVLALRK